MNIVSPEYGRKVNWFHIAPLIFYFLLSPFYVFPSGFPQIADIIILMGIIWFLIISATEKNTKIRFLFFLGISFAIYTVFINLINYIYFPHTRFLLSSLYYPYNIMIFIYAVKILERYGENLYKIIYYTLAVAIISQLIWAVSVPQDHWREIGSFNNPNQLAYWSLLTATIIVLLKQNSKLNLVELSLIILLGFIQTLALSKAGLISYSIFLIILFFSPLITTLSRFFILFAVFSSIAIGLMTLNTPTLATAIFEKPIARIQNIGEEADDSAEARGYNRPIEFPAYLIFGAGEGAYKRFEPNNPVELHSGIVTIMFSYGIMGFVLFCAFLIQVFNKKPLYILLLFIPVLMFGISGQSFRFSHFWIFLAFAYLSNMPNFKKPSMDKINVSKTTQESV